MKQATDKLWYTENLDVGSIFCPKKQKSGEHKKYMRNYNKGDYIYMPGHEASLIYFLNDGRVKIGQFSDNGREITKAILDSGELFGELAGHGEEETRRDFAYAMTSVSLCIISKEEMKTLMRNNEGVSRFIMNIFAKRIVRMEKRLENLVFKDSRTRVIDFLVELVEEKGQRVGFEWVVRRFLTHQEIANLTATSRQTVTTVLNELKTDNLITFDRRRLLVRDLDMLKNSLAV